MPPAHAELYEGPHADWLLDMLDRLPYLQCLAVDALSFFDHSCLLYLRRSVTTQNGASVRPNTFGLRLLSASYCFNATYTGLCEAIRHFPRLIYFDLSYTRSAKEAGLFRALATLPDLQILKLRALGLTDDDIMIIAESIGLRVRSLDLRDNFLTDTSARSLLQHCFKRPINGTGTLNHPPPGSLGHQMGWNTPAYAGSDMLSRYQAEDLDRYVCRRLTSGYKDALAIEDDRNAGITHLYVANNKMTVEGLSNLISSARLKVIDCGGVATEITQKHKSNMSGNDPPAYFGSLPGAEKLKLALGARAAYNLTYLRVHHAVVTKGSISQSILGQPAEMQGSLGIVPPARASELDLTTVHQTSNDAQGAFVDSTGLAELPGNDEIPRVEYKEAVVSEQTRITMSSLMRGSVFAPVVMLHGAPILNATGSGLRPSSNPAKETPEISKLHDRQEQPTRRRSYSNLVYERQARSQYQRSHEPCLTPAMLPLLRTLVLTNIPETFPSASIGQGLINYIQSCAKQKAFAREEARLSYTRPPGQCQRSYEREYVRSIAAIERIVLETTNTDATSIKNSTAPWRGASTGQSSTEDADSDAFWAAAQNDFTFFDEDECGLPLKRQPNPPMLTEKMTIPEGETSTPRSAPPEKAESQKEPVFDVIAQVSAYRRDKKTTYEALLAGGRGDAVVDGYWDGEIQVVRPHLQVDGENNASRDFYGNLFQKGYLYR